MEIRTEGYEHSVEEVSLIILGNSHRSGDLFHPYSINPYYADFLEAIKPNIAPSERSGRDSVTFCHHIIHPLIEKVRDLHGYIQASDSVPWTIAAAITVHEPHITTLSDFEKRFLLDLALGIPVTDYLGKAQTSATNGAYQTDPTKQQEYTLWRGYQQYHAQKYQKLQEMLRTLSGEKVIDEIYTPTSWI